MEASIQDTGISVVHEPKDGSPAVDILIVHGLQGHPFRTWVSTKIPKPVTSSATDQAKEAQNRPNGKQKKDNMWRFVNFLHRRRASGKMPSKIDKDLNPNKASDSSHKEASPVYWPADLLPKDCPKSRILVYGYDTKITKYMTRAANTSSILSHSKDLLFALSRARELYRPLILVAHSLGGIIVKEMLANSSLSTQNEQENIVKSTAAVVFLGTPHRGSPDLAAAGERMRSLVGTLGVHTSSSALDALGLKTTELERAQEGFSRVWQKYDFRVKTFQEGLGLTGVNFGLLGQKVVPDYSSLIGDQREHAETIDANHMDMCRFNSAGDSNYHKLAGELRSIYGSIVALIGDTSLKPQSLEACKSSFTAITLPKISGEELWNEQVIPTETALQSLRFSNINTRLHGIERPAMHTSKWLFEHELYKNWFDGSNRDEYHGLLWLKGKLGAGKSVLMKEAFHRAVLGQTESEYLTAAFFFNGRGEELERSSAGLFRSLLYQLLPSNPKRLKAFTKKQQVQLKVEKDSGSLSERELKSFFRALFDEQSNKTTFIFIDALDECELKTRRTLAYFWREITNIAYAAGVNLNVCLSSRHFPTITVSDCAEIILEDHNRHDIATYIHQRFKVARIFNESAYKSLNFQILNKSSGVFLWVVLVVDNLLKMWDEGRSLQSLMKKLDILPEELEVLFSGMFEHIDERTQRLTFRFFQWAIFAAKPLRLHEWHHILAFIREPTPRSLSEWRLSDNFTENDVQLEKQIRDISKGLVEVKSKADEPQDESSEEMSAVARAGSLDLEDGETRIVQVIHESVRDFFLHRNGFRILNPSFKKTHMASIAYGHSFIMATCLDYLNITELDALAQARSRTKGQKTTLLTLAGPFTMATNSSRYLLHHKPGKAFERDPSSNARSNKSFTFEMIKNSFTSTTAIDIPVWLISIKDPADRTSLNIMKMGAAPVKEGSVSGTSKILEAYPALLSYAVSHIVTHLRRADGPGVDLSSVLRADGVKEAWNRWIALNESVSQQNDFEAFISKEGLEDVFGKSTLPVPHCQVVSDSYPPWSSSGSVASFGSAGSHGGSRARKSRKKRHNSSWKLDLETYTKLGTD